MNQDFTEQNVIAEKKNGLGIITLNKPKALNALNLEMVREIASALHEWETDREVQTVVIKAVEGRSFCSGGDVKAFYHTGMDYRRNYVDIRIPLIFFAEEYSLNKMIASYPKTTVAIMDGIVMGGGYGIAGHCKYRVASERALFAMPEVFIGLFPDVGSMYHLTKAPNKLGKYLALTGSTINGKDMVRAGLADILVCSKHINELYEKMYSDNADNLLKHIKTIQTPVNSDALPHDERDLINQIFSANNIEQIIAELNKHKSESPLVLKALQTFEKVSPLSVSIALEHYNRSKDLSVDEVLNVDYTLVQHFIQRSDLYEGIRATIIDKDKEPSWTLSSFSQCTKELVQSYFAPTSKKLSDVEIFQ